MAKTKVTNQYNDDSITVLEGLEGIRKRFDMYVGGKDSASFHLVKEVVDNSVDEVLNNFATKISVEYIESKNLVVIEDDGRGLPTGMNTKLKKPTIEVLFTHLHAGGKFDKNSFKVSGGKNGIGVKATNALSEYLLVESFHNGEHYSMEFSKGKVVKKLAKIGKTKKHGTKISFTPDTEILGEFATINIDQLKEELNKRAYINAGLVIELKVGKEKITYVHENGIEDYLTDLNPKPVNEIIGFDFDDSKGNNYQVVFNYANETGENIRSFVNGIVTSKGTHEQGFKTGLTTAMLDFIKNHNLIPKKLEGLEIKGEDIREGLYAIINLKHVAPEFRGQVKDELSNSDVLGELKKMTHDQTTEWLDKNPEVGKKIATRVIAFAKGRKEANAIKDKIIKVNSGSSGLSFMATFTDCDSRDISKNEVIIIEGKSAGGNVRNARDEEIQAVFPLRGKPLNTYGVSHGKILSNREWKEFIKVMFGTTDIKNIDVSNPRYGKINILADADDDGYHIVSLILEFIHEHFPQLFEDGRVFISQSPLYRVTKNGKYIYFKNDAEYDKFVIKEISNKYGVKEIVMSKFIITGKDYTQEFNRIKSKYNLDTTVLNVLENHMSVNGDLFTTAVVEDLEQEFDLTVDVIEIDKDTDEIKVQGLYEDMWLNFTINEEFVNDITSLSKIFKALETVTLTNKKDNTEEEFYIYDALEVLNNSTKFERVRFKGLGEADAEELFDTTLNPKKRDLIQVNVSDFNESGELTKVLFGNNADLRKDFINEHL
jgi:DNA gyrase subunit B